MKRINWNIPGAAAAALLAIACGSGTSVSQIPVGDPRCPNGGADVKNGNHDQIICSAGPGQLTKVSPLAAGDTHCPAGGEQIDTGVDNGANGGTAGDGILQPGEITSTQYVCATGSVLSREIALAEGDARCPSGGTELDIGLDDGKGGGIAGNGILENGEVRTSQYICSSNGALVGSFVPPAGDRGTSSINLSGGNGIAGNGGNGNYYGFYARFDYGSLGGHLKVFATGAADAGFTATVPPAGPSGVLPVVLSANTEIIYNAPYSDAGIPVVDAGVLYTTGTSQSPIYLSNGDGGSPITDLQINAGVRVQFDPNNAGVSTNITLPGALRNAGTMSAGPVASSLNKASLFLQVGSFVGLPGSSINARGLDAPAAGQNGGNGGQISIVASQSTSGASEGTAFNAGSVDSSGGNGDNGGSGGGAEFDAEFSVTNTGNIVTRGGNATLATGFGGSGGYFKLYPYYGDSRNSGPIDVSGGSGGTQGGRAGSVSIYPSNMGGVRSSGTIVAVGGDASASCSSNCYGGRGGYIDIEAYGGDLISSGSIIAHGGSAPGTSGSGGSGNQVYFFTSAGSAYYGSNTTRTGNITVSGNLDVHGGDGANGGQSGQIYTEMYPYQAATGSEIAFLGYGGGINLNGGNGTAAGGSAGRFFAFNNYSYPNGAYATGGSVLTSVDMSAVGGNGTTGPGGQGGYFDLTTQSRYSFPQSIEKVIASGTFNASGGNGTAGGSAGGFKAYGRNGVMNSGSIKASAGTSSAASTRGGTNNANPQVGLYSDTGLVLNSGAITSNGGNASGATSAGGSSAPNAIQLVGLTIQNSGALSCVGGNGTATGGNGGGIHLSSTGGVTNNTGALLTSAGTGTPAGTKGSVFIDGTLIPN